jgi:hypothetical protein
MASFSASISFLFALVTKPPMCAIVTDVTNIVNDCFVPFWAWRTKRERDKLTARVLFCGREGIDGRKEPK